MSSFLCKNQITNAALAMQIMESRGIECCGVYKTNFSYEWIVSTCDVDAFWKVNVVTLQVEVASRIDLNVVLGGAN